MDYKGLKNNDYGRLMVLYQNHFKKNHWVCQCVCGKKVSVLVYRLKNGSTKSCGCLRDENFSVFYSLEYRTWKKLKKDKRFCRSWKLSFNNFLKDVGKPPSNLCDFTIEFPKNFKWINNHDSH